MRNPVFVVALAAIASAPMAQAHVTSRTTFALQPAKPWDDSLLPRPAAPFHNGDYRQQMRFAAGLPQFYVNLALAGANRHLQDAECRRVFDDFRDRRGDTLADDLERAHRSPVQFLADLVWVDASDDPACDERLQRAASTTPESHTIFVCGTRFADKLRGFWGEMVIIHEMLHALGLGENPPTSREITHHVADRCG
jgi:hypothetical protein